MILTYNAYCFDILKDIPDDTVDCVICDLPYGVTAQKWDNIIDFGRLWEEYKRVCKDKANIILFASGEFTYKLYSSQSELYKYKLIWKKNVPTGMNQAKYRPMKYYEEILVFQNKKNNPVSIKPTYNPIMKPRVGEKKDCYKYNHYCGSNSHIPNQLEKTKTKYDPNFVNPSDILEFNVVPNRGHKQHPTQKPVELLEYLLLTYSNESDIILDNCIGVGSCGVACVKHNRNFIGVEKDKKYFDIAVENIQKEMR
jgi:site-specific DNA-methyltransferase (adenine-specific)